MTFRIIYVYTAFWCDSLDNIVIQSIVEYVSWDKSWIFCNDHQPILMIFLFSLSLFLVAYELHRQLWKWMELQNAPKTHIWARNLINVLSASPTHYCIIDTTIFLDCVQNSFKANAWISQTAVGIHNLLIVRIAHAHV